MWIAVITAVSAPHSLTCCTFYEGNPAMNPRFEHCCFATREQCQRFGDDWKLTKGLVDYRLYGAHCRHKETGEVR